MINGLYNILTSNQDKLPLYHANDICDFIPASKAKDLIYLKPKNMNVSQQAIDELICNLKEDDKINLAGLGIMIDGKVICEHYEKPYSKMFRHVSFSLSKSVVAMAVGIAISEGLLSLDDKLYKMFPGHDGIFIKKNMKEITIRHLLTMSTGVSFDEFASFFTYDWCTAYMGSDVKYLPGTSFSYNSLNTYMLVAYLRKCTGVSLIEYLDERLFKPLNICDITWDKCPRGIEKGGWGLKLSLGDMLKLGQLYLNKGVWIVDGHEKTIISKEWIEESIEPHFELDSKRFITGYGYHIWLLRDGSYLFNGIFGQNIYVNPDRNIVIAITASAYELFPEGRIISLITRFVNNNETFKGNSNKKKTIIPIKRVFNKYKEIFNKNHDIKEYLSPYLGMEYIFDEYASSIIPVFCQVIYSNYLSGIKRLSFDFHNDYLLLKVCDGYNDFCIRIGYTQKKPFIYQVLDINGKKMPIAVSGKILFDEDGKWLLKININYLEEVGCKIFKIYFYPNKIRVKGYETPDMYDFTNKLFGDKFIRRTKNIEKNSTPEYVKYKIQKILSPDVWGIADE